jgi:hypothetical protein
MPPFSTTDTIYIIDLPFLVVLLLSKELKRQGMVMLPTISKKLPLQGVCQKTPTGIQRLDEFTGGGLP